MIFTAALVIFLAQGQYLVSVGALRRRQSVVTSYLSDGTSRRRVVFPCRMSDKIC